MNPKEKSQIERIMEWHRDVQNFLKQPLPDADPEMLAALKDMFSTDTPAYILLKMDTEWIKQALLGDPDMSRIVRDKLDEIDREPFEGQERILPEGGG